MNPNIATTVVAEGYAKAHDNGFILPRHPAVDMLATRLRALHEQRDELHAKVALVEAELCAMIGVNAGVDTHEGRITWKMGPHGDVDWRGVAMTLGADKQPNVIAAHRGPARRRLSVPRTWKRRL